MFDLLFEPLRIGFVQRGLLTVIIVALVCAVIGVYVVLRELAFLADALAHGVFPGVVLAAMLGVNIFAGALLAGIVTSLSISLLSRQRLLDQNVLIGVVFAGMFAFGLVLISQSASATRGLSEALFGNLLAVRPIDLWITLLIGGLVLGLVLLLYKELLLVTFDRELARSLGLPVWLLDAVLWLCLTLAIVVALQALGNLLAVALLVVPAATARLLVRSVAAMIGLAALLAVACSVAGVYLAYYAGLASGAAIVLVCVGVFLLVLMGQRLLQRQ